MPAQRRPARSLPASRRSIARTRKGLNPMAGPGGKPPDDERPPARTRIMGPKQLIAMAERIAREKATAKARTTAPPGTRLDMSALAELSPAERAALQRKPILPGLSSGERIQLYRLRREKKDALAHAKIMEQSGNEEGAIYAYALYGDLGSVKRIIEKVKNATGRTGGLIEAEEAKFALIAARGIRFNAALRTVTKKRLIARVIEKAEATAQDLYRASAASQLGRKQIADGMEIYAGLCRLCAEESERPEGKELADTVKSSRYLTKIMTRISLFQQYPELQTHLDRIAKILRVPRDILVPA